MAKELKVHKLLIQSRSTDSASTGANTQVLLDGKILKGVTAVRYEVAGGNIAKVTIEMLASVKVEARVTKSQIQLTKQTAKEIAAKRRT